MDPYLAKARYDAKLIATNVGQDLTAKKPDMITQETSIFNALENLEAMVRGILSGTETIPSCDLPWYHDFARQCWKVKTHYGGGYFCINEIAILKTWWTSRGLDAASLQAIIDECFIIPPA